MNEKVNLVELLKDCPKGMELDCTMFDDVYLEQVDKKCEYPIVIRVGQIPDIKRLTKEGCWNKYLNAKCVIFPKGKTTWEGFQRPFKDGDIIVDKQGSIAIYKQVHKSYEEPCVDFHCRIYHGNKDLFHTNIIKGSLEHCGEIDSARFATEEEKTELFNAIKANGYRWNTKTKNLEKLIIPMFKVGTKIIHKSTGLQCTLGEYAEGISAYRTNIGISLTHKDLEQWELAPNKFDINTLNHFDKVLVRHDDASPWCVDFFSFYDEVKDDAVCTGEVHYDYCIPYDDNTKHLVSKIDEAPAFYRYWEE